MREDRPADTRATSVTVLAVEQPIEGASGATYRVADDFGVVSVDLEDLSDRIDPDAEADVDCLLVSGDDRQRLERVLRVAERASIPTVVSVATRSGATAALEAGATEVYEDDGGDPGSVLAARIRSAIARGDQERPTGVQGSTSPQFSDPGPDGGILTVDPDLAVGHCDGAAGEVLDQDPDSAAGRHLLDILPGLTRTDVDPQTAVTEAIADERRIRIEGYAPRLGRWIEFVAVPDEGGASVYLTDVTDRTRREERLKRIVRATRDLMAADTVEEVTRVASEAATDVLDSPGTAFRRYDPDLDALVSVALGSTVEDIADRPTYDVEDTPHGRAFRTGRTVVETPDDEDDQYGREVFSQTMYVPVGGYGVLSAGITDGEFDATDRQLAELLAASTAAALEHADRQERLLQYEGVVEEATGMVFAVDETDRLTVVSEHLADRVGYDRERLRGQPMSRLFAGAPPTPGGWTTGEDSTTVETTVETASGETIRAELTLSPLSGPDGSRQGAVGTLRDITELAEARERLADERDRFTYLFENLPDAVAEVEYDGQEGIIRSVNTNFRETFSADGAPLVGRPLDEFVLPPALREEGKRLNARAAAGETIETEVRRQSADGPRYFLLRVVPYESTDDTVRSFTIYTDITEQKQRERYLRVMNRVLRHNLRNDLNVVQGYAELLASEVPDATHREYAARIERTVDRIALQSEAARTVQDAIGDDRQRGEPMDIAGVVRDAVEAYGERYPGATITTDLPVELRVRAGPNLDLIVDNLVENAIVHTGPDPTVHLSATEEAGKVCFRVTDDGPGIPDSERAIITEDREITQLEHGSGLGLWVVKWLVENYGGHIDFVGSDLGGAGVEVCFHASDASREE